MPRLHLWPLLLLLATPAAYAARGDTVFLIEIDGLAWRTARDLYARGELPNLRRLANAKGGRLMRTVTTFPSSTAPSMPELLVGRYSDRCAPDLLRRVQGFDRTSGKISRYEFIRKAWDSTDTDLFDLVARDGRRSFSYFEGAFRSASVNDFNPLGYRIEFATGYARLPNPNYDRQVIDEVLRDVRTERPPPALVFIGLGAADIAGHSRGPEHAEYRRAVIENDVQIGRLIDALSELAHPKGGTVFDHSHFYVFGDHGMASTEHHLNIGRSLSQIGVLSADGADLGAMLGATVLPKWHRNVDAVVLGIGSNLAEIQVRRRTAKGRRPWRERPSLAELRAMPVSQGHGRVDLVGFLSSHAGIALVMVPESPGRIQLFGPGGREGLVVRDGAPGAPRRYAYQVRRTDVEGRDPLGYLQHAQAAALVTPARAETLRWFNDEEWLAATQDGARPYAPPLIPKAFDAGPTAPDLIIASENGFGFLPVVRGDHGNLTRESLSSFLLVAGPKLGSAPAGTETVRLLDLNLEVRRQLELPEDPLTDSRGLSPTLRPTPKPSAPR